MDNSTRAGTAGGTFQAFIANLGKEDILKTMVILTTIGAVVSLLVSIVLQFSWSLIKKGGRNMLNGFINFVAIDKSLLIHEFIL